MADKRATEQFSTALLLIVGLVYLLGPAVFGIETNTLPAWVTAKP